MTIIYVLIDEGTGEVGYVGQTVKPDRRLVQHRRDGTLPCATFRMETLEECRADEANSREDYWIVEMCARGAALYNSRLPWGLLKERGIEPARPVRVRRDRFSSILADEFGIEDDDERYGE